MRPTYRPRSLSSYALAILILAWSALSGAAEVAVVISADTTPYREVAQAVRSRLGNAASISILPAQTLNGPKRQAYDYLVAVGSQAAQAALASELDAQILLTLLPRNDVDRLIADRRRGNDHRSISAIYLDQPFGRQMDLIRLALPEAARIGVLLGPDSGNQRAALQSAALERRLHLNAQKVEREGDLAFALNRLLPEVDVLLALPDPVIFNPGSIQLILLGAYRQKRPLVGFSPSYVRAGAILSLHSTPEHIGHQAAEMLLTAFSRGRLPASQYPHRFAIASNPHVARSLGIDLQDEDVLTRRMKAMETP